MQARGTVRNGIVPNLTIGSGLIDTYVIPLRSPIKEVQVEIGQARSSQSQTCYVVIQQTSCFLG
jgi:hypothetical protein